MVDVLGSDMSPEARTERLYWFLRNLGLAVEPEMEDGRWCALRVAVNSAAQAAEGASKATVHAPVEGAQVVGTVPATQNRRDGVVDFPAVR